MVNLLIVTIIIGIVFNKYSQEHSLEKLNYKRELSSRVVEIGEEFEITTIVENAKYLPVSFLQIKERLPLALEYKLKADVMEGILFITHKMTMILMPFQRIKRTYKVSGKQRGKHMFKEVTLTAGDFLGLKTTTDEIDYLHQSIVILPKPIPLEEVLEPFGDYNGEISVKRWIIEDPIITAGIREYTGNEPEKNIHWASTLKTGELMVKRFDYTSDNTAIIMINGEYDKHLWGNSEVTEIETCYSLSRTVMEEFEKLKIPYAVSSNVASIRQYLGSDTTHTGQGTNHFYNMLEALGAADYNTNLAFSKLLLNQQNNNYATYVIITPVVMEDYVEYINMLSRNVCKVILISMNDENLDKISKNVVKMVGKSINTGEEVGIS